MSPNNRGEGTHKCDYGWNKISYEPINYWNGVIGTWIFIIYYMLLYVIKHFYNEEFKIIPLPHPQQKAKSPPEFMNSLSLVFFS